MPTRFVHQTPHPLSTTTDEPALEIYSRQQLATPLFATILLLISFSFLFISTLSPQKKYFSSTTSPASPILSGQNSDTISPNFVKTTLEEKYQYYGTHTHVQLPQKYHFF